MHPWRASIVSRYASILFIYLARHFSEPLRCSLGKGNVRLVSEFLRLVERNFKTCKSVKQYAAELHVSPNYLNEVVRGVTGSSAGNQIRERIVLEAKRRAICPQTSMKEVALDLGYDDVAHFSKFFKTVCGKNFSTYKKERFLQLA